MFYELIHDSIAKQVFGKVSRETQTRRRIEKYIKERHQAYNERNARLTQDDIDYISPYLSQVNISLEAEAFLEEGQNYLTQARRRRRIIVLGVIITLAGCLFIATWQWFNAVSQEKEANEQKRIALDNETIANQKAAALVLKEKELEGALDEAKTAENISELRRIEAVGAQNIAFLAKEDAESQALFARAIAIAAKGRQLMKEDQNIALSLAMHSMETSPNNSALELVSELLADPSLSLYREKLPYDFFRPGFVGDLTFSGALDLVLSSTSYSIELHTINEKPLWELRVGRELKCSKTQIQNLRAILLPNQKGVLAGGGNCGLFLISLSGEVKPVKNYFPESVTAIAANPSATLFLIGQENGATDLINDQGVVLHQFSSISGPPSTRDSAIKTLAITSTGDIFIGDWSEAVTLFRKDLYGTYTPIKRFNIDVRATSITHSPDERFFYVGAHGKSAQLWSADLQDSFNIPGSFAQFHPSGKHLIVADDTHIKIYEDLGGYWTGIKTIDVKTGVNAFSLSSDGRQIICHRGYGYMGTLRSDPLTETVIWSLIPNPFEELVTSVYSPDIRNEEPIPPRVVLSPDNQYEIVYPAANKTYQWGFRSNFVATFKAPAYYKGELPFSELLKRDEKSGVFSFLPYLSPNFIRELTFDNQVLDVVFHQGRDEFIILTAEIIQDSNNSNNTVLRFFRSSMVLDQKEKVHELSLPGVLISAELMPDKENMLVKFENEDGFHLFSWTGRNSALFFPGEYASINKDGSRIITTQNTVATLWNEKGERIQNILRTDNENPMNPYYFYGCDFFPEDEKFIRLRVVDERYGYYNEEHRLRADYLWEHENIYRLTFEEISSLLPELYDVNAN